VLVAGNLANISFFFSGIAGPEQFLAGHPMLVVTVVVMNLTLIAALTAFVAFEKLAPPGMHGARISGVLLIAAGFWMLVR